MSLRVEFTVEPFVPGAPGPHVLADAPVVVAAVEAAMRAWLEAGASRVSVEVSRID